MGYRTSSRMQAIRRKREDDPDEDGIDFDG
jgi:hypothetical protein